jgi:hypothetical protein
VRNILAELGIEVNVKAGGSVALQATLRTPNGEVRLT